MISNPEYITYPTRTIISCGLYIFTPFFTAVYIYIQFTYVVKKEILQFLGLKSTVYNWEWFQVKSGLKWCLYGILNAQFENQVWKGIYWTVVACVNDKIKIRELVLYYGPIDPWNAWKIFGKNTNYIHRFTLSKFFGLFGCISSIMHGRRRPRRLSSTHRCVWTRSCPIKFGIQTEKTICYTVV